MLGAGPLILGMPWTKAFKVKYPIPFAFGIGYFLELALFHITAFPFAYFHHRFRVFAIVYSILLGIAFLISVFYTHQNRLFMLREKIKSWPRLQWHEWVLLVMFIVSLGVQIYYGFVSDLTYMAADDSAYTAMANDVLVTDYMATTDPYTGVAMVLDMQRAVQTSLYYPAYLTAITGISVAAIEHTAQYIQFLFLAYMIYIFLSGELFDKRDNRLAFLAFVSVFYIFGYHSLYSLTFRLLGPNYQGKAVLAVSLTPLTFGILIHILKEKYNWRYGMLLCILSTAAISLTMWSTGTLLVIITIPVVLSLFRKQRNWKYLWYVPWGVIIPMVFVVIYSIALF